MTKLPDARLYIDGTVRDAAGGGAYAVLSPWTDEVVTRAADAAAADVEAAIAAARRAFDETDWAADHAARLELVKRLRDLIKANRERFVEAVRHEAGSALGAVPLAQIDNAIAGMDAKQSERFLDGLLDAACRPPRVYEHHWTVGDVAVWDNRCVLHRARPWDLQEVRVMKHTRIKGNPVTEAALAPAGQ